jgi:hypothetical protein
VTINRSLAGKMINTRRIAIAASCLIILGGCVSTPYDRGSRYGHPYVPPSDDRAIGSRGEFARLAHELDDRAFRAHEIAERRFAGFGRGEQELFARIHHFSDQVHLFHEQLETGELSGGRLRGSLEHLIEDARETDRSMRQAQVFPETRDEWQGVLRVLDRMLALVRR